MRHAKLNRMAAMAAGALVLMGGATIVPLLAKPTPAPTAYRPTTPGERKARTTRARVLAFGILTYTHDHESHFPPSLGATLSYQDKETGARAFLTPDDEKKAEIPDPATVGWVNEHTSFVYLADANLTIKALGAVNTKAYELPILYEKLEGREEQDVAMAFLDGHSILVRFDEARKMIDEAKLRYARLRGQ